MKHNIFSFSFSITYINFCIVLHVFQIFYCFVIVSLYPVIWNFINRLVKVSENFYSFKQILCKHAKIIDNFSFDKGITVVTKEKDDFVYF